MNASQIISEDMTLEEKLKAIDEAIAAAQNKAKIDANKNNAAFIPVDPSDLTMCEGCQ
mgnify:FL=1